MRPDLLAFKAPNFTKENAGDMARRATIAREARRHGEKISREIAQTRPAIEVEVHRVSKAMAKLSVMSKDYARLANLLDSLWDKAFPKQGTAKGKRSRGESSRIEPDEAETTQENSPQFKHSGENPSAEASASQAA